MLVDYEFFITGQCKTKTNNLEGGKLKQQLIENIVQVTLFEVLTSGCLIMFGLLSSSFLFGRTPSATFCSLVRLQGKTTDPPLIVCLF